MAYELCLLLIRDIPNVRYGATVSRASSCLATASVPWDFRFVPYREKHGVTTSGPPILYLARAVLATASRCRVGFRLVPSREARRNKTGLWSDI